jgi:hypothetical protein
MKVILGTSWLGYERTEVGLGRAVGRAPRDAPAGREERGRDRPARMDLDRRAVDGEAERRPACDVLADRPGGLHGLPERRWSLRVCKPIAQSEAARAVSTA